MHIRCSKGTGFARFPSRHVDVNATWIERNLAAIEILAWARVLLLDGEPDEQIPHRRPRFVGRQLTHTFSAAGHSIRTSRTPHSQNGRAAHYELPGACG
ncbi:hypothetical protein ACIA8E_39870 [Streptomyces sp. NPDC051664]|uniref:hypothetical protein n=1 Tax=Streptomyces sp. NPDC051664 TaxID=3365668 RepID=UPI00378B546E